MSDSTAIFYSPQLHTYPPESVQKLVEPVAIVGGCHGISGHTPARKDYPSWMSAYPFVL